MKVIFYSATLFKTNLTITDKIVYSQLVYRSLWDCEDKPFDSDGTFSIEKYEINYEGYIPVGWTIDESISSVLNISRAQYFRSKAHLFELGYVSEYGIRLVTDVTANFFELKTDTGLSGMRLIVYSYIAHKNKTYGWYDKYHVAMAKELGIKDVHNLEHILTYLRENRFISVKYRGKQTLLRAN